MNTYTVALVEDERIMLDELLYTIPWDELGLEVCGTAMNGLDGEKLLKKELPDLVITDIRLPGQDGLEMLEKAGTEYAIILSGYTDFSYTRKAIQLGVFDYLQKPYDDEELIATIKNLLRKIEEDTPEADIENTEQQEDLLKLPTDIQNHTVRSAIHYMEKHYTENIGLQDVARHTRTSENHLSAIFKEESGLNFLTYLNAVRINQAARLMRETSMNIAEVSRASGFQTPSYFARMFRRFTGKTPSEFRDNL